MRLKLSLRKILSVIATSALLFNSLSPSLVVLAQEVTPSPTPGATTQPTDQPTIAPTDTPTGVPTPTEVATPTPEVVVVPTPATDLVTPTPEVSQPGTPTPTSENTQPQAPPTDSNQPTSDNSSTSAPETPASSPTVTPEVQTENGHVSAVVLDNTKVDTSSLNQFDLTYQTDGSATISTDKLDYSPSDSVLVTGVGFIANKTYTIEIVSQDPPAVDFKGQVKADDKGDIVYSYQLDGNYRPNYTVYIKNGDNVIASTTFTDSSIGTYDQCSNDTGTGYTTGDTGCRWINGNLQQSNSKYYEGDSTVQRLWLEGFVPGSSHTVTFNYGTTKGGKHAYDFLTTWDYSENWITLADRCQGIAGCTTVPETTFAIPQDTNALNLDNFTRNFTMRGGTLTAVSIPTLASGTYAGDSDTSVTITFTVASSGDMCSTKQGVTTCDIATWFGAHVAESAQWASGGAGSISGSPYHVALDAQDGSAIGSRDNQMAANAVVANPTLATTPNPTSGNFGVTLNDTGTLTNGIGQNGPTGTIAFSLFPPSDPTCSGTASYTQTVNVSNSSATTSPGFVSNAVGTWHWSASYSGDSNNNPATSICSSEPVTINSLTPTVTTTIHDANHNSVGTSVSAGSTVHDSASVTGSNGTATGSVTFTFYTSGDCTTGSSSAGNVSLNGSAIADPSSNEGPLNAGSYSFKAHYGGDSHYSAADSACEPLTVNKLSPSISTTLSASSVGIGVNIHDSAALTGATSNAGGTVTYHAYAGANTCTGTDLFGVNGNQKTVTNGSITDSDNISFSSAGTYSFQAVYSGDSNNNGATSVCSTEQLVVNQNSPTISTILSPASPVLVGSSVHDSSTLSGATTNAGGTVTYSVYTDNACTNLYASHQPSGNPVTVTGGVVPNSGSVTFDQAGTYYWQANYSGDGNNIGAKSSCGSETLVVDKAQPSIVTNATSSVNVGANIKDTATISNLVNPDGTAKITFNLYSDNSCQTQVDTSQSGFVTANGNYDSANYTTTSAGTYYWIASYPGDSNNKSVTTSCGDANESSVVNKVTPSLSTDIHNASHGVVTSVIAGSTVHDKATISGGYNPSGNVEFTFFPNDSCTNDTGASAGVVALSGGVAHPSSSEGPLNAGGYSFQAHYVGDINNNPADSGCEPLSVTKLTPTLTTTATAGPITVGGNITDTAHLGGGYSLTGSVTFDVFAPGDTTCSTPTSVPPSKTVAGSGDYTSGNYATSAVGLYRWIAHYSGDGNNNAVDTACNDSNESSTTQKATPALTTTATAGPVTVGDKIHDVAHLSGGFGTLGGTITFKVFAPSDASCQTPIAVTPDANVNGAGDYTSSDYTSSAVGTYNWIAHYSGDANNNSLDTACGDSNESSAVQEASPAISTTPSPAPTAVLGATLNDSATLSGGYNPTGTILFALYAPNTNCTGTPAWATDPQITVNGNGTYSTNSGFSALIAGIWNWKATYSGDANNNTTSGKCGDEPVEIQKAALSISTEIHLDGSHTVVNDTLPLGSSVHDSASVSGVVPGTTPPDVSFYFFDKGVTCTNGDTTNGVKLNTVSIDGSGIAHPSTSETNLPAGDYNFMAVVGNNDNYTGSISDCEPFTVNKAQLRISTEVHNPSHNNITNGNVDLGSIVHDTATISGTVAGFTAPEPTFTLTNNYIETCSQGSAVSTDGTDPSGAIKSADSSNLSAGNYAYHAAIEGNDNYIGATSSCEPFSVDKANPTVTTTIHHSDHQTIDSNTLVNIVHDLAQVLGIEQFVPTRNVDFSFYTGTACDSEESASAGTVALDKDGIAHPSDTEGPLSPGLYSFRAHYLGDDNYNDKYSSCEPFTVVKQPSILITKTNNSGGGISAGNTVTYTLSIENNGGVDLSSVIVTDFLPGGFTYVDGSTTGATFIPPQIGSKLTWDLGSLDVGQTKQITYQASTDSSLGNGDYVNFATCQAYYGREQSQSTPCNQTDSKVTIGSGPSFGGNLLGQVLGISTELPATGSPTMILLSALGLLGIGIAMRSYNSRRQRKHAKN